MDAKGGFEMKTIIVVGAAWISILFIFLWLNYRFHLFMTTKTANLSLKVPVQQKAMANGAGN
jgi:hypothetical protein